MRELVSPDKLTPETVNFREIPKKYKFMGTMKIHKGHSLFAFDLVTFKTYKVNTQDEALMTMDKSVKIKRKVNYKENTLYTGALNIENAKKKFEKMLFKMMIKSR